MEDINKWVGKLNTGKMPNCYLSEVSKLFCISPNSKYLVFANHRVSITIQLCLCSKKIDIDIV